MENVLERVVLFVVIFPVFALLALMHVLIDPMKACNFILSPLALVLCDSHGDSPVTTGPKWAVRVIEYGDKHY